MSLLPKFIIVIVVAYLLLALLLYLFQAKFVYFPSKTISQTPSVLGLAYEPVTLLTADEVEISAWYVPRQDAVATLLFFHGNAGNVADRIEIIHQLHQLGFSVFMVDYRGYGNSAGTPTEAGTYEDASAAWHYLRDHYGLREQDIIIYGHSLGGAIAAWLAAQHTPRALILEAAFSSFVEIAGEAYPYLPVSLLVRFGYDTRQSVSEVTVPVLIIHSTEDRVINYSHAQTLFDAAVGTKQLLTLRGSHDMAALEYPQQYRRGLMHFVTRLNQQQDEEP